MNRFRWLQQREVLFRIWDCPGGELGPASSLISREPKTGTVLARQNSQRSDSVMPSVETQRNAGACSAKAIAGLAGHEITAAYYRKRMNAV